MKMIDFIAKDKKILKSMIDVLAFYGNPETYIAIGFLADNPCGEFMDDFCDTGVLGFKPGKKARILFEQIVTAYNSETKADKK